MATDDLRIGFIGSGYIAGVHAAALSRTPGVRLAACTDVNADRARGFAEWTGCTVAEAADQVIMESDAVWICTPPTVHREQAVACLEAGRHIYCEKPLAGSLEDGRAICAAAEASEAVAAIGFNFRFCDAWLKAREAVDSGAIGEPKMFVGQRLDTGAGGWRVDPELMVGMTVESVSHDIDLLRWFMGDVASVSAHTLCLKEDLPGFDNCLAASLRTAAGGIGSLQATWAAHAKAARYGVIGTKGSVYVEGPRPFHFTRARVARGGGAGEQVFAFDGAPAGHGAASAHLVNCIRTGRPPSIPIADGLRALEVCRALVRSSEAGGASVTPT
jgi:myo-inositol 2-dehydrogenase/D-chiro-inositol 1-dehydrogenase